MSATTSVLTRSAVSARRRRMVAVLSAGALVVGGGAAFAYWSTTGTGTGSAATGVGAANLTIAQTAAPTTMAPGIAAGPITGTVKNNATTSAYVTSVTVAITSVTKAAGVTGTCDATDYTLTNPVMSVATDIAAGATVNFSGASLGFNNKGTVNQDACKGATLVLGYTAA